MAEKDHPDHIDRADLTFCRNEFPALNQTVNGHPVVFLDGPGGTQVPSSVAQAVSEYLLSHNANTHGAFRTSHESDAIIERARAAMAALFGCTPSEVAFGQNMSTLNFALSRALGRTIKPGDEVVVTDLDHEANRSPWEALAEKGAVVKSVKVNTADCTLDMEDFAAKITPRTRLVAVGWASNAVGTINDVAAVAKMAHAVGAAVMVDAVHYAPHEAMDVKAVDCDFLICSAYKFFGPHIGVLYGKREAFDRLGTYKVRPQEDHSPFKIETGTLNHEGIAGAGAAVDFIAWLGRRSGGGEGAGSLASEPAESPATSPTTAVATVPTTSAAVPSRRDVLAGMEAIEGYEKPLARRLQEGFSAIPGVRVYGLPPAGHRTPTVSITVSGKSPEEVAAYLASKGVFVWNGDFYASTLVERLGLAASGGLVRFGLAPYNTAGEIEYTLEQVAAASRA